jgi:NADH:ubiquinone oxidoreductase subunit 6 (subunit J)
MILETTFLAMAALVLGSAMMALRARELIHATIWLALMLLGVAGIFLTLGGEFLATIQVLVYVGAVITLILFTVMLTIPPEPQDVLANLPPGVHVESVEMLQTGMPSHTGAGPYKDLDTTNPRRPQRKPADLYGVSLTDNEYGTDSTDRTKKEGQK